MNLAAGMRLCSELSISKKGEALAKPASTSSSKMVDRFNVMLLDQKDECMTL
jgi:hypothetical protein